MDIAKWGTNSWEIEETTSHKAGELCSLKYCLQIIRVRTPPPNNPITARGATSFPGYHSFPKWAILCWTTCTTPKCCYDSPWSVDPTFPCAICNLWAVRAVFGVASRALHLLLIMVSQACRYHWLPHAGNNSQLSFLGSVVFVWHLCSVLIANLMNYSSHAGLQTITTW